MTLYLFVNSFEYRVTGIQFFRLFEIMIGLHFADGFSILLNFVSFLCWFHIYQLKTRDYVILLMRFVWKNIGCCSVFTSCVRTRNHGNLLFIAQVALVALATNPSFHKDLLSTVKSWPSVLYSALPVISAIEPQLNTSSMTDALKEVQEYALSYYNLNPLTIMISFTFPVFDSGTS